MVEHSELASNVTDQVTSPPPNRKGTAEVGLVRTNARW